MTLRVVLLAATLALAGCAAGPAPSPERTASAREVLAREAQEGPVAAVVHGAPLGLTEPERDQLVTEALAEAVRGLDVRFSTAADAPAGDPRLVVLLNPVMPAPGGALCRAPDQIATGPAQDQLRIVAAFCQAGEPLSEAQVEGPIREGDSRRVKRLLWRTAGELFPDDYPSTYGLGILPDWLDIGVGATFGF